MRREEESGGWGLLTGGDIKEILSLIRNLQDADGQGTVSDGG